MKHRIITTSDAILYGMILITLGFSLAFVLIYVGLTRGGGCV